MTIDFGFILGQLLPPADYFCNKKIIFFKPVWINTFFTCFLLFFPSDTGCETLFGTFSSQLSLGAIYLPVPFPISLNFVLSGLPAQIYCFYEFAAHLDLI